MKKIIKRIKNEPMLIVLLIILVCFMPAALFSAGESNKSAIVTAIGIDMVGQEYEVSLLTFIPTPNQTYLETDSVISGTGETVADAIMKAELTLGKKIGLSHAKTTVVSFGVLEKNVAKEIDYLSRVASLSENTVLICTDKTAKEFLEASQKLEKDVGLKLDQLIEYNTSNIYITDTTLETFYKGYYSENSSSILGFLTLEESAGSDSETGGSEGGSAGFSSASGGGSGGGGAGMAGGGSGGSSGGNSGGSGGSSSGKASSGGQSTKQIKNAGDIVLLKHGKLVSKLTQQQLLGINIINPSSTNDVITIYHKGDGLFGDALLTYQVNTKRVMTATKFENGNPVFSANVVLGLDLVEGQKADGAVKNNTDLSEIPASIAQEIEREVKSRFADALRVLRENKTDVIGVREKFERDNRKAFRKFLEGLDDADDYLNHINFQLVIRVQPD